ncbi:MAG: NADH-quinone oxidoreductase subunit K [Candidatus Thermoplasmatota archaeon]|nr:NADH-quinone oxidoreductase subunit K [Candidatus Thermoplasmatota archaeon]
MTLVVALAVGALYASGTYLLLRRNLLRTVLGLALLSAGANLLIFTAPGLVPGIPPIIEEGAKAITGITADPVPQALILTSIVITFGVQAFVLALIMRTYQAAGSDDPDALVTTERPQDEPRGDGA